jgi:hypothetical protein
MTFLNKITIKSLTKIKIKEIERNTIIYYDEVRDFCLKEYPGHPNGCPNVEKCRKLNFPSFKIIDKFGGYNYYYLIYAKFNRKEYRISKGNRDNLRWWQGSIKARLKKEIIRIIKLNPKNTFFIYGCGSGFKLVDEIPSMEYCCINVFSTMRKNGIKLYINPKDLVYLVCLISSVDKLILEQKGVDDFFD